MELSHGWSIRYQLKELNDSEDVRMDTTFSLPWEEISFAVCNSISNSKANPGKINIACSLSDDLQYISVMHSIFKVAEAGGVTDVEENCMQILDFSEIRRAVAFWEQDIGLQFASFPTWLWTYFSPYGSYLLASNEDGKLLLFEERPDRSTCTTSWKHVAQTTLSSISNSIFHPKAPLICLTSNNSTYLWSFGSSATCKLHEVVPYVLGHPDFTHCGQYLEGYRRAETEPRAEVITLSLNSILDACHSKAISKDVDDATITAVPVPDEDSGRLQRPHVGDGGIGLGRGLINRQKLNHYAHDAAIIWEHPTKQSRTVLRLPRSLAATNIDAFATLSGQDESQIFVYLDKAQQESYDLRRPAKECFPIVLKRQEDTLAVSNLRLLPEQPEQIEAEESELSVRKEENTDDDSGLTVTSAQSSKLDMHLVLQDNIHRRFLKYRGLCTNYYDDFEPFHASPSLLSKMNLMFWHSFLNASAKFPPKTYPAEKMGHVESTIGQVPLSTIGRRKTSPLLLEGPEDWVQAAQPVAPHTQAKTRRWRDRLWLSNDFNWGVLYGLMLGVFTSLITISIISLR